MSGQQLGHLKVLRRQDEDGAQGLLENNYFCSHIDVI